ncbi:MAG: hypothetical protein WBC50_02585 [Dehalococcoidales bacterium]
MKVTKTIGIIALALTIFATILSGCSFNRWVEVAGGDYLPVVFSGLHQGVGASLIESMNVDRNKNTVNIHLKDGAEINADFKMRPKKDSPSGCPSNINATKMEVLELLVRNCPRNPEVVILREDGQIGGSGTACAGNDKCIHFKPVTSAEPMQTPVD